MAAVGFSHLLKMMPGSRRNDTTALLSSWILHRLMKTKVDCFNILALGFISYTLFSSCNLLCVHHIQSEFISTREKEQAPRGKYLKCFCIAPFSRSHNFFPLRLEVGDYHHYAPLSLTSFIPSQVCTLVIVLYFKKRETEKKTLLSLFCSVRNKCLSKRPSGGSPQQLCWSYEFRHLKKETRGGICYTFSLEKETNAYSWLFASRYQSPGS